LFYGLFSITFGETGAEMIAFFFSERFWRLSKEVTWVVLGQVLATLGSLVGVRVLTGMLSPSTYGELALGMTAIGLVYQVVFWPLSSGAVRFYAPATEDKDLGGYLNAVRRLALLATGAVVFLTPLVIMGLFITAHAEWLPIAVAAIIFVIFSGNNDILSEIQNAARHRYIMVFHQAME